jgi:hypothetical protein
MHLMRAALTIYLVFATLVGPTVCCCSARLLAAHAPRPATPQPVETPPAECPHCHKHTPPAPTDEKPQPAQKPECPCCARGADPVLMQVETDAGWVLATLHALSGLLPVDTFAGSYVLESSARPDTPVVGVPFLTAQDLLRAHHLLRC